MEGTGPPLCFHRSPDIWIFESSKNGDGPASMPLPGRFERVVHGKGISAGNVAVTSDNIKSGSAGALAISSVTPPVNEEVAML